ncbi:MAG TPA: IS5 family transposase [Candidatus Paceibacterota bacterium]|nr:IS5 family transposase [Candidatus Paceibacterota bacterium]
MRGKPKAQPEFLPTINLNQRVPADHPLRGIKGRMDKVLAKLSPLFDALYAEEGRPSIPPEQLLKSRILMALYAVRSERLFCKQLAYNLLWLWFLDRELDEGTFDPTVFTHNYERVLSAGAAQLFFAEVYGLSQQEGWARDQHFTADGTLIEAWASLKSFVRKDGKDRKQVQSAQDDDPGNPTINFHGEKRIHATPRSTTDPQSVRYRKASGRERKLCFGAPVLMENRHGFCAAITVHNPIAQDEPTVALAQGDGPRTLHGARIPTLGADKANHQKKFVAGCRAREISPHVACKQGIKVQGLDRRTSGRAGDRTSQRLRKRVEEIFGWMKTVAGLRRTRYRGVERTQAWAYFVAGAYNLLRLVKLSLQAG